MKKIICIGECSLNIVLDPAGKPLGSIPGGRILNAAIIMGRNASNVIMASEAAQDSVGDILVKDLTEAGVDITSVDRFTEGHTPINVFISDGQGLVKDLTRYEDYPDEAFDIIWPRIDEGDIILFGGYYAIDHRMRERMSKLLAHAVERKAILIYLPGFLPQQETRITHVMPAILENLEIANIVVARDVDLKLIFGIDSPDAAYHRHIDFYCRSLICVDAENASISYYSGKEVTSVEIPPRICSTLIWNSGAAAGITEAVAANAYTAADLEAPADDIRRAILGAAAHSANEAAKSLTEDWQAIK